MIQPDWSMVVDTDVPKLNRLYIYGSLELQIGRDHVISANLILITGQNGMLRVGYPNRTMPNDVIIRLLGNHDTPDLPLPRGPNLGAKALGVFGKLELFGRKHRVHWTRLSATMEIGSSIIQLVDAVDWRVGDEVTLSKTNIVQSLFNIYEKDVPPCLIFHNENIP